MTAAPRFRRAEMVFDCGVADKLGIRFSAFFDIVGEHVDFAQIQFPDGELIEQLFTAHEQSMSITQGGELKQASFGRFVEMGMMHIFTGIDHMSFILGLLLLSASLKDVIRVVTGFTIGHSITLALAVTGVVRPHAEFIDALVALTITLIGLENVATSLRKPDILALVAGAVLLAFAGLRLAGLGLLPVPLLVGAALFTTCYLIIAGHLRNVSAIRMIVTTVFGLIHGFGFAADLLESQLPKEKLAEILIGFNLGVEIGQLCVVLAVTAVVWTARRIHLATPRPITVDLVASSLVGFGLHWFVERCFI